MPTDEARYDAIEDVLYIRDNVFGALDHAYSEGKQARRRARFTIAHELGHVAQNHSGVRFRGASGALAQKVDRATRHDENEAQRFAAAFLIPFHLADAYRSAEDIADLFDVNISAADIRQKALQKLDRVALPERCHRASWIFFRPQNRKDSRLRALTKRSVVAPKQSGKDLKEEGAADVETSP